MSCCSRMLGLEHVASRGSISIEYYGRDVGIKIMPTGVKPERFLNGFGWQDTIWRRGELLSQVTRLHLVDLVVDLALPSQLMQTPFASRVVEPCRAHEGCTQTVLRGPAS